jgi:DNA uptake protein ComE-like DNA-binding protein
MPDELVNRNSTRNKIRAEVRRRNIINLKKNYVFEDDNLITIKNKKVSLILDSENKTLNLSELEQKHRVAYVIWQEQSFANFEKYDNYFEQAFDNICFSFNEKSCYEGILNYLNQNFKVETTNTQSRNYEKQSEIKETKFTKENTEKININLADEEKLSTLPGISVITAKKIIKYRDLHGGFKDLETFYEKAKLKKHFQNQIKNIITIEYNEKEKNIENRIIDI